MKKIKVGKIRYNQKTPPSTITYKQVSMANEVAKEIASIGIDCKIEYSRYTIDIIVVMDSDQKMYGLNLGTFRVFWDSNEDNKLQYLGVGIGHYDGYEIKRGWTSNLEINSVANVLKKDIEYYQNRKLTYR